MATDLRPFAVVPWDAARPADTRLASKLRLDVYATARGWASVYVDRRLVPHERSLPPSPPEALAGEQRLGSWWRLARRDDVLTRLEALRLLLDKAVLHRDGYVFEVREPIPVRPDQKRSDDGQR